VAAVQEAQKVLTETTLYLVQLHLLVVAVEAVAVLLALMVARVEVDKQMLLVPLIMLVKDLEQQDKEMTAVGRGLTVVTTTQAAVVVVQAEVAELFLLAM
jgi:hypothetical protein